MQVRYGNGAPEEGTGVWIEMSGDEVAHAIDTYLVAHNIHVDGPRTVTVNGGLCRAGSVYVDPEGFVIAEGRKWSSGDATEGE